MNVIILEVAQQELAEAIAYYNQQSEGLGYEFAAEFKRTVARIQNFPRAWAPLSARSRRCRTNRFPYGVIYQIRDEQLLIVAVMELHRDPKSWQERV